MIYTTYEVQVPIPDNLFEFLDLSGRGGKFTRSYERDIIEAEKGSGESGTDYYGEPYEYATFTSLSEARKCEKKLIKVIEKYMEIMEEEKENQDD